MHRLGERFVWLGIALGGAGLIWAMRLRELALWERSLVGFSGSAIVTVGVWGLLLLREFELEKRGPPWGRRAAGEKEMEMANRAFELLESILPKRLCKEDLGDALELIARLVELRRPRWQVYLKIGTTVFWACWSGVREIVAVLGRKSSNR
jgi:hypothetical protein